MTDLIHPNAVIHANANIADNVKIGPFCVIGENVTIGANTVIHSNVVIEGDTKIGESCNIFPFASIGHIPQDLKFGGEKSRLEIGDNNTIREHVTMNPGTVGGGLLTKVGNNCLFMVGSHVAHDCIVGDNVIMANNATLAGHVHVGDFAIIGGLSAVRQFVRIGHHAMIGGMSGIESDIIPFGQAMGERANLTGLNLIGLKRREFERDEINNLRSAYRLLFSPEGTLSERIEDVKNRFNDFDSVKEIIEFLGDETSRAICQPKSIQSKNQSAA